MTKKIGIMVYAAALMGCADHPSVPAQQSVPTQQTDRKLAVLDPAHPLKYPTSYYSRESLRHHEEGTCVVQLIIGVDGKVQDVTIKHSTGNQRLDDTCLKYLRTTQFLPAIENGIPIVSSVDMTFTIGLKGNHHPTRKTPAQRDMHYPLNLDKFYPLPLRDLGEEGSCIVNAHVQANGVVREAKIFKTTGFATLDDACIKATLSIWFIPARENGMPVESWTLQPITWAIHGTKPPAIDPKYSLKVGDTYYPEAARALQQEGDCIVAIFVSEDGTLVSANVDASTGFPLLDQASLSAVKEAKFTPGIKNNVPTALPGYVVISWRLKP